MGEQQVSSAGRDRIVTLDVIRGIAVMGIFSVNVVAFAMIFPAYMNPTAMGWEGPADWATWFVNFVLIDGKMRSLFSMLFGASMLLVIERAAASGRSPGRVHYARMIVLALFGLLHFYVIWHGDILFMYAVGGMIAFLFRRSSNRKLLIWSACLFLLSAAFMTAGAAGFRYMDQQAHSADATPQEIRQWNKSVAWGTQSEEKTREQVERFRSPLPTRVEHVVEHQLAKPFGSLVFMLPDTLALMLLGMLGFRSGFLTGDWADARYRRIAAWTLSIGAAAGVLLAVGIWRSNFYLPLLFFNFLGVGTVIQPMMALGYAALIILLFRRDSWLRDRVAAAGRCAFTNYLGTSILAAFIFFGDGLGLFARLSRAEAWLFVPLFWLLMLAWSKPWLDRFNYGPFEWAWRSLARGRLQPMRKTGRADPIPAGA